MELVKMGSGNRGVDFTAIADVFSNFVIDAGGSDSS
jgi:hypothetical protein